MMTRFAGGLMCAAAMMLLSGCTLTIVNNDGIGSAIEYEVRINGALVDDGTIAYGNTRDVDLGFGGEVTVSAVAVDDGFDDEVTFNTIPGKTDYTLEWVNGFPDAPARGKIR